MLAPGVGFEPTRAEAQRLSYNQILGSQGRRFNHSAIPARHTMLSGRKTISDLNSPNKPFLKTQARRVNHAMAKLAMGYSFLEHTTDALTEAWGPTIVDAFGQAGIALFDTMLHVEKVDPVLQDSIEVTGHDEKELLYNWLEELLLKFEISSMAYSVVNVTHITQDSTGSSLKARVKGEAYNRQKHGSKTEVKGITYHLMEIVKGPTETRVRFLLDL